MSPPHIPHIRNLARTSTEGQPFAAEKAPCNGTDDQQGAKSRDAHTEYTAHHHHTWHTEDLLPHTCPPITDTQCSTRSIILFWSHTYYIHHSPWCRLLPSSKTDRHTWHKTALKTPDNSYHYMWSSRPLSLLGECYLVFSQYFLLFVGFRGFIAQLQMGWIGICGGSAPAQGSTPDSILPPVSHNLLFLCSIGPLSACTHLHITRRSLSGSHSPCTSTCSCLPREEHQFSRTPPPSTSHSPHQTGTPPATSLHHHHASYTTPCTLLLQQPPSQMPPALHTSCLWWEGSAVTGGTGTMCTYHHSRECWGWSSCRSGIASSSTVIQVGWEWTTVRWSGGRDFERGTPWRGKV